MDNPVGQKGTNCVSIQDPQHRQHGAHGAEEEGRGRAGVGAGAGHPAPEEADHEEAKEKVHLRHGGRRLVG